MSLAFRIIVAKKDIYDEIGRSQISASFSRMPLDNPPSSREPDNDLTSVAGGMEETKVLSHEVSMSRE
jgi:hypothetical protein